MLIQRYLFINWLPNWVNGKYLFLKVWSAKETHSFLFHQPQNHIIKLFNVKEWKLWYFWGGCKKLMMMVIDNNSSDPAAWWGHPIHTNNTQKIHVDVNICILQLHFSTHIYIKLYIKTLIFIWMSVFHIIRHF